MQSNGASGKSNRKPPPSSQGIGVVDVPGSHYSKSSELSRGSFIDPFFSTLAFGMTLSPENWNFCAVNMQI